MRCASVADGETARWVVQDCVWDPTYAALALRAALPEEIGRAIDWDSLTLVPGTFVDQDLVEQVSDLLFEAEAGKEKVLLFLFEHQSTVDLRMPLRILGYMQRIWGKHGLGSGLPPIVPVVLHHARPGRNEWRAATSMGELYELGSLAGTGIEGLIPQFSFVLEDLSLQSDEEFAGRSLGLLAMLVYAALRDVRVKGFPDALIGLADLIRTVRKADGNSRAYEQFSRIFSTSQASRTARCSSMLSKSTSARRSWRTRWDCGRRSRRLRRLKAKPRARPRAAWRARVKRSSHCWAAGSVRSAPRRRRPSSGWTSPSSTRRSNGS